MTDSADVRAHPVRTLLGMALLVLAACLVTWFAFALSRGPSECGGGAPACSAGFVGAFLGFFASIFVLGPVGFLLAASRVPGVVPATLTLALGGASAAIYVGRFVTAPVTATTTGQWIAILVLAALAAPMALGTLLALLPHRAAPPTTDRAPAATSPERPAASTPSGPRRAAATAGPAQLHALLVHGLASGELGDRSGSPRDARSRRVLRLLELHQRGVLTDDDLRDALDAQRADGRAGPG